MVSSGMAGAGYTYINIDDEWAELERSADGSLVADTRKFPSGMKNLSDYIHGKGLKFGLYTDVGVKTCGGQPGSYGHECQDAQQFAAWGVDWLKEDHCNLPANHDIDAFYNHALGQMRDCLNVTGRPIHFDLCAHSCYDTVQKKHSPACWAQWYTNATMLGNSWRSTTDINSGWKSILNNLYRNDKFANMLSLAQFNGRVLALCFFDALQQPLTSNSSNPLIPVRCFVGVILILILPSNRPLLASCHTPR
jgi:alpha-galactosidase